MVDDTLILGAGMTGLAAGMVSGHSVLEAGLRPGGICLSYRMRPGEKQPLSDAGDDDEVYRFENGGGHWIFGGDPLILRFIRRLAEVKSYVRRSSVFFPGQGHYVPYPLQNHLRYLDSSVAARALAEMVRPTRVQVATMEDWIEHSFGRTLSELFFRPFHELYTAGLYTDIAPQDGYKSPVNLELALQGAFNTVPPTGYNTSFVYPKEGLDLLAARMAARCRVQYDRRVVQIDTVSRSLVFATGERQSYGRILSTLPLNRAMEMAGLSVEEPADPYTSVLVVNIGAVKGKRCPDAHWLYVPRSESGFHRVGFYSNVDSSFLPATARGPGDRVSIYVERAFPRGQKPSDPDIEAYCAQVVEELQQWGFIEAIEVVHPTWVDVAYTWSRPGSRWPRQAMQALEAIGVFQVGRYGRWLFQGIADSIRDGFVAGACFRDYPGG